MLGISDGIEPHQMGTIKWDLALSLLGAWIVVYLCICKGIRTSGKVHFGFALIHQGLGVILAKCGHFCDLDL